MPYSFAALMGPVDRWPPESGSNARPDAGVIEVKRWQNGQKPEMSFTPLTE